MDTTQITIPKKEIAPGIFTTGGIANIPTNPVISVDSLKNQTPINIPKTEIQTPNVDGDIAFYNQLQNQLTTEQQNALKEKETAQTDLTKLLSDFTGQGAEQASLEKNVINPIQGQLQDLTGQIGSQLAEYNALKTDFEKMSADIEAGAGRKGLTTGAVMGQQGAVERAKASRLNQKASEIGLLQAQAQAVQGKLDLAQNQIDRAIDLKYKSIEQEIEVKKFQLGLISENLTKEEKKRADALNFALNKEEKRIAEEKQKQKDVNKMIIDATPNAPTNIIAKAKTIADKGGSSLEVAQALGKYGGDYLKTELLKAQINTEKAQANKINTETGLLGKPVGIDGIISTLPKSQQERYYKLQNDFDQATKNYRGAIDSASSITALSKDATPQQQTAIIFQYMKTLDPTSTVREGEFALVGKTAGLGDRAVNALKRLDSGSRLNENQINDIVGATKVLSENAKKNLELTSNEFDRRAEKFGLPKGLFYEKQEIAPKDNKFIQALPENMSIIPGTSIINSVLPDGTLNFNLPK